jgi:hypothetical protein
LLIDCWSIEASVNFIVEVTSVVIYGSIQQIYLCGTKLMRRGRIERGEDRVT